MIVLDSDHLTILAWEDSGRARALETRLAQIGREDVATTAVNYEESCRGWLSLIAESKKMTDQIAAYRRLVKQLELFCSVKVLDFDEHAAVQFQRLRKEHRRLGAMDLKIAAVALANNAKVITRNLRHFQQIPGLQVEDWTQEP